MTRSALRNPVLRQGSALLLMTMAGVAWAHHPMGGSLPSTAWQGLLSGIGHPVIGLDHLAFIVAIGLICAFAGLRSPLFPFALVAATVLGAVLSWAGVAVPAIELVVALSLLGAAGILLRMPSPTLLTSSLAVVAAVFHGLAYGEAIIGAEPTPLVSYLLGFSLVQMTIAGLAFVAGALACNAGAHSVRVTRKLSATLIATAGAFALLLAAST